MTAPFAGAQRASGVGGTIPAPACPFGETGKGVKFLAAAGILVVAPLEDQPSENRLPPPLAAALLSAL